MPEISSYEKLRQQNIDQNRKILKELGLLDSFQKPVFVSRPIETVKQNIYNKPVKRVRKSPKKQTSNQDVSIEDLESCGAVRRSGRIKRKPAKRFRGMTGSDENESDDEYECSEDSDEEVVRKPRHQHTPVPKNRENIIGAIASVPVGKFWNFRSECSYDGIHRPLVAGIHGNEKGGCFSIALSGGYEDDLDYGEYFTYTGCGGRDLRGTKNKPEGIFGFLNNLRTAPQSKDQTLVGPNLALSMNVESKQPVRVIRGFKLQSPYAPKGGYRYDGLYTVEKYWFTTGLSGFGVYKFALRRCEDQASPSWHYDSDSKNKSESGYSSKENGESADSSSNSLCSIKEELDENKNITSKNVEKSEEQSDTKNDEESEVPDTKNDEEERKVPDTKIDEKEPEVPDTKIDEKEPEVPDTKNDDEESGVTDNSNTEDD
ncbi:E3 ubiquitin-protein ligase UHRF1 [Nymphon striatum]|nr:E3 ubiquitin-protein ligase UHRF1 [Nymphon striatum]